MIDSLCQRKCHRLVLSAFLLLPLMASAQAPQRGSISGSVTADQGAVRGFRVKAHNLHYLIWYTVFTRNGHYTVPQALPGPYEVSVLQGGYDSPTQKIDLGPGQSQRVDIALKKRPEAPSDVVYKAFDEMYPPGPGLELLKRNCLGCHGPNGFNTMHSSEIGFRAGINEMTFGPFTMGGTVPPLARTQISAQEKETMAKYLAANFGPDSPNQRLKHDPYLIDEDGLSKAIFVEYDISPKFPPPPTGRTYPGQMQGEGETNSSLADIRPGMPGAAPVSRPESPGGSSSSANLPGEGPSQYFRNPWLHDPYIAKDNTIWYGSPQLNALVHLDPRNLDGDERWHVYQIPSTEPPYVFIHGIALDSKGRVYWAEIRGGKLGEFDPATGKWTRHTLPTFGSLLQVVVDQQDNVWYNQVHGSTIGKLDARTRRISQWATPTPDTQPYGLAVDRQGNIWTPSWAKGLVIKFDPNTETFTEYAPPTLGGSARRIGVDSKNIVWFSEWSSGLLGSVNPATGKVTEYKLPIRSTPYETWPDKSDRVWMSDDFNNSLICFDRESKTFSYYPLPQVWRGPGVPKVEVEENNTIWIGSRGTQYAVAVHFYPQGYTAQAPPEP